MVEPGNPSASPIAPSAAGSVAISFLRVLVDYAYHHELDSERLFEDCGIPRDWLQQPSRRIDGRRVALLFDTAAERLNDPLFGLHLGQFAKPWHYDALGYLLLSTETYADALQQYLKYEPIVNDMGHTHAELDGNRLMLIWTREDAPETPRIAEENLARWLTIGRWLAQRKPRPRAVYFQHSAQDNPAEYERLFECPVHFNQSYTGLELCRKLLNRPLSLPDPPLRRALEARADAQLAHLASSPKESFCDAVRFHLEGMLREGTPSLQELAERMNMSLRTLQRRLTSEGYSYKDILDEVRHSLALRYITHPDLPLHSISALLGFSDQSAFQRAFKRWTGRAPGRHRRQGVRPA